MNMLLLMNMLVASGLEPFWMHRTYISPNRSMRLLEVSAEKCLQDSVALMCMASLLERFLIMSVRGPNLCMASFFTPSAMVVPLTSDERPRERMKAPYRLSLFSIFLSSRMMRTPGNKAGRNMVDATKVRGKPEGSITNDRRIIRKSLSGWISGRY